MATRGYMALDIDLTFRGRPLEVDGEYHDQGELSWHDASFGFFGECADVFIRHPYSPLHTRICEVEALGGVLTEGCESRTNHLHVLREVKWDEVMTLCDTGEANTGPGNGGRGNTGCRNRGSWNSGTLNTGWWNSGFQNTGDRNSGFENMGDGNSGDFNWGDGNSGRYNVGSINSGCRNIGRYNTGDENTGDENTGSNNLGDGNSGNGNCGDGNSGNGNVGHHNSGDYNLTSHSSGVLCTQESEFLIFDRPAGMTRQQWSESEAARLLGKVSLGCSSWVDIDDMAEKDIEEAPFCRTTMGHLRSSEDVPKTSHRQWATWWLGLSDDERRTILAIPNFDVEKWQLITGLDVHGELLRLGDGPTEA